MTLDFLNDVFGLHLALETAQRVLERFPFLQSDFSQLKYTSSPIGNLHQTPCGKGADIIYVCAFRCESEQQSISVTHM